MRVDATRECAYFESISLGKGADAKRGEVSIHPRHVAFRARDPLTIVLELSSLFNVSLYSLLRKERVDVCADRMARGWLLDGWMRARQRWLADWSRNDVSARAWGL